MHSNTEVLSTLELETGSRFSKIDMILESVLDPNADTGDATVLTIKIEDKSEKVYATFRLSKDELFKLRNWLNGYVCDAEPAANPDPHGDDLRAQIQALVEQGVSERDVRLKNLRADLYEHVEDERK